jgi:hypothetical protein
MSRFLQALALLCFVLFANSTVQAQFAMIANDDFGVVRPGFNLLIAPHQNDIEIPGGAYIEIVSTNLTHGSLGGGGGGTHLGYSPNGTGGMDSLVYRNCYSATSPTYCGNTATIYFFSFPGDGADSAGGFCPSPGKPVNPTNGNMWLEQTDYNLPGAGENIYVSRFYNSMLQNAGLLGRGWSTQYDESLAFYGNRMVRLNMSDGQAVYLGRTDTTLPYSVSPSDFRGQIVQNADNTYTLKFKDGRIHQFNSAGRLLS